MANSSSDSPSGSASSPEYAGFWSRFLAFLIDSLIVTVVLVPLMIAIYGLQYFDLDFQLSGQAGGVWDWVVNLALAAAAILFWRFRGATPGKMAIGARIVDARTGGAPTTGTLVLRFVAYVVSMLPFFLGFLWIAFDKRKQGFHDKIARTVVVYEQD
ncbi:MAG TPA: RDD family protein [Burkholderiales bacterium]